MRGDQPFFKRNPVAREVDVAVVALGTQIAEVIGQLGRTRCVSEEVAGVPVRAGEVTFTTGVANVPVPRAGDALALFPESVFELRKLCFALSSERRSFHSSSSSDS